MSYDPQDSAKEAKQSGPGLFDFDAKKLARRDGPDTSKEAAESITEQLGCLQAWVHTQVRAFPRKTVSEMAQILDLRDPRKFGRRLNELARAGLIVPCAKRRCAITGRNCTVYEVAE